MSDSPQEKPVNIRRAIRNADHPYFPSSRAAAQDTSLTYEAAGLLWYLLSKPDTWNVIPSTLLRKGEGKKHGTSRGRIYKLLNELIGAGYIERIIVRDERGRMADVEYVIHESPSAEFQDTVKPDAVNQHNRNKREGESKEKEGKELSATQGNDTAKKGADKPKPERKRNPLYDGIAVHLFKVSLDDEALMKSTNGRILGLMKFASGRVEPLALPAFVAWYQADCPKMALPTKSDTFPIHWARFENSEAYRIWQNQQQAEEIVVVEETRDANGFQQELERQLAANSAYGAFIKGDGNGDAE